MDTNLKFLKVKFACNPSVNGKVAGIPVAWPMAMSVVLVAKNDDILLNATWGNMNHLRTATIEAREKKMQTNYTGEALHLFDDIILTPYKARYVQPLYDEWVVLIESATDPGLVIKLL